MIKFLSVVLGIGFGFGVATFVFSYFLNESNNIGDSVGSAFYYVRSRKFHARMDKMTPSERHEFISRYHRLF
jgi:hypothetical protein